MEKNWVSPNLTIIKSDLIQHIRNQKTNLSHITIQKSYITQKYIITFTVSTEHNLNSYK